MSSPSASTNLGTSRGTARSASRARLLAHTVERIAALDEVPSYDGAGYMRGHVAFEGASDQQGQILDWLIAFATKHAGATFEAASVGAGSGILDVPMLEAVCQTKRVEYTVFEPFEAQCRKFEQRAAHVTESDRLALSVECAKIEEVAPERQFDVVFSIHSIYSFEGLEQAVARLIQMTRPGGELVIAVAPLEQMNQLAEAFWQPQHEGDLGFEEQVVAALRSLGADFSQERIDAELQVSLECEELLDIASFLVQCPLEQCPEDLRALVLEYLQVCGRSTARELVIPHPVQILRVRRPQ